MIKSAKTCLYGSRDGSACTHCSREGEEVCKETCADCDFWELVEPEFEKLD